MEGRKEGLRRGNQGACGKDIRHARIYKRMKKRDKIPNMATIGQEAIRSIPNMVTFSSYFSIAVFDFNYIYFYTIIYYLLYPFLLMDSTIHNFTTVKLYCKTVLSLYTTHQINIQL